MKKVLLFSLLSLLLNYSIASTYSTGFEDFTKGAYAQGTITTAGLIWDFNNALNGNLAADNKNGSYAVRIKASGYIQMTQPKTGGAGTISFNYANYTGDTGGAFDLLISTDGGTTWITLASGVVCSTFAPYSISPNISGNIEIKIVKTDGGSTNRINIDDVTITDYISCVAPIIQASAMNFSSVNSNSLIVNWTRGDGTGGVLVLISAGSPVSSNPVSGSSYTANAAFGTGTQIGTGNYVIYDGTGTSVNVTGLAAGTTYYLSIYEYNTTSICYATPGLTGNMTTSNINVFPYIQDFNSTNGGWITGGTGTWVWGYVNRTIIKSPSGTDKAWTVSSLTSSSSPNSMNAWVQSPSYDFTTLTNPHISFSAWWEAEQGYDGTVLEYSTNGGTSWSMLGSTSTTSSCLQGNWYNSNSLTYLSGGVGWSGSTGLNSCASPNAGGSGAWVTSQLCLPIILAGQTNVKFRFRYGDGSFCNGEGFAFDNFKVEESPVNPAFTFSCTGNTINFTNATTPCASNYLWNFGDGTATSTVVSPSHAFATSGSYNIILSATNACGRTVTNTTGIIVSSCTPLPVDLVSFSATGADNGYILFWVTANESSMTGYEIQRSSDGVTFDKIGFESVQGKISNQYEYFDKVINPENYYRLKIIELNGRFTYSKIVYVDSDQSGKLKIQSVFPQPASEKIDLKFNFLVRDKIHVSIFSVNGSKVGDQIGYLNSDAVLSLDVESLVPGLYLLLVDTGKELLKAKVEKE